MAHYGGFEEAVQESGASSANRTPERMAVPEVSFAHLILDVHDMDASLGFYHGLLSFPIIQEEQFDGHRLVYLQTGLTNLLLVQQPVHEQNPALERAGGQVMKFKVKDLQSLAAGIDDRKVKVLRGLEMAIWGERTFLVADPDGYAVLLSEQIDTLH